MKSVIRKMTAAVMNTSTQKVVVVVAVYLVSYSIGLVGHAILKKIDKS